MIINKKVSSYGSKLRIFTFCLIIFQSIGTRFFDGQGIFISLFVIVLNFNSIKLLTLRDYRFLFFSVVFLISNALINPSFSFSSLVYQILLIFSTYLLLIRFRGKSYLLQKEFFTALTFFAFHAFLGYVIYLIMPEVYNIKVGLSKSFAYLFYVSNVGHGSFMGFGRNTGLFWEPGVLQLAMNLFLFYCIKFKKSINYILIGVVLVVSSFSTTGFLILLINLTYFLYIQYRSRRIKLLHVSLVLVILTLFIPILNQNTKAKFDDENTSGLVRYRDFQIGLDLIKEKPLVGHGVFDEKYLGSKSYVRRIENNTFSKTYLDTSGDMSGGYTNGLLGLIAWYGIPVSFLLYLFYFKNKFIESDLIERLLFCSIFLISMITEPIAYTSLFLMFPLSYWILHIKFKKN